MDNIAFFNRVTLALFERLYSSFPTPIELDVKSIAISVIPEEAEFDEAWNGSNGSEVLLRRQEKLSFAVA